MTFFTKALATVSVVTVLLTLIINTIVDYKRDVKRGAQLEWNNKQLELVLDEQKKYSEQLAEIAANQGALLDDMKTKNDELNQKLSTLDQYLNSKQAEQDDRPSSNVLKETVKQLSGAH